jgi:hypothetical protein
MNKQTLYHLEAELKEIIRLEGVMKFSVMILDDVISLQALARRGIDNSKSVRGTVIMFI